VSLADDRRQVLVASKVLSLQRTRLHQRSAPLRDWVENHRATILVTGGFLSGLLLGRRQFASVASSIVSTANLGISLMRSSLASILLAKSIQEPARTTAEAETSAGPQG
jgi:hypothetical protein